MWNLSSSPRNAILPCVFDSWCCAQADLSQDLSREIATEPFFLFLSGSISCDRCSKEGSSRKNAIHVYLSHNFALLFSSQSASAECREEESSRRNAIRLYLSHKFDLLCLG